MKYYDISKGELVDPDTPTLGEKFSIAGMDRDLNIKTASLPYGTQGTYGAPEETSMPNIQDLIREEGIQVGPQVKDGGLIRQNFAAIPLVINPTTVTAVATALGITFEAARKYINENPQILDSITSKFGQWIGPDAEEMEKQKEELKELTKPVGTPIKDWSKSFGVDEGTKIPEKLPESKGLEIPPVDIKPQGLPIPKQKTWEDYALYKKTLGPGHGGAPISGKKKVTQFTKKQII